MARRHSHTVLDCTVHRTVHRTVPCTIVSGLRPVRYVPCAFSLRPRGRGRRALVGATPRPGGQIATARRGLPLHLMYSVSVKNNIPYPIPVLGSKCSKLPCSFQPAARPRHRGTAPAQKYSLFLYRIRDLGRPFLGGPGRGPARPPPVCCALIAAGLRVTGISGRQIDRKQVERRFRLQRRLTSRLQLRAVGTVADVSSS